MSKSTVYIDESGDLGKGKGTRWFVITAVIVKEENEPEIEQAIRNIKEVLKIPEIHIKKISDFYKRMYIAKEASKADFTYANVIVDTQKLDYSKIGSAKVCYNYMCRMLLERVSWFLRDEKRTASIVLSARGEKRDKELIEYIKKLTRSAGNRIEKGTIENIISVKSSDLELLQLADICATTTFLAYEENKLGMSIPCLFNMLKRHLYSYSGKIERYGVKGFIDSMAENVNEKLENVPCRKR